MEEKYIKRKYGPNSQIWLKIYIYLQEAQKSQSRINIKKTITRHIIVKLMKAKLTNNLEAAREKHPLQTEKLHYRWWLNHPLKHMKWERTEGKNKFLITIISCKDLDWNISKNTVALDNTMKNTWPDGCCGTEYPRTIDDALVALLKTNKKITRLKSYRICSLTTGELNYKSQ